LPLDAESGDSGARRELGLLLPEEDPFLAIVRRGGKELLLVAFAWRASVGLKVTVCQAVWHSGLPTAIERVWVGVLRRTWADIGTAHGR
jgi:hypothetical protein